MFLERFWGLFCSNNVSFQQIVVGDVFSNAVLSAFLDDVCSKGVLSAILFVGVFGGSQQQKRTFSNSLLNNFRGCLQQLISTTLW